MAERLEYTEVVAIDLAIKASRLNVALDGQEQYRDLRQDVLDAVKVIEGLARRFAPEPPTTKGEGDKR